MVPDTRVGFNKSFMSDWLNEWINSSGNFLAGGIHLKKNLGADITVLWLQSHYVKWEDSRHRRIPACLWEVWSLFRKSVQTHWNNWIISTNLKFEGNQYACLQSIKKIDLYRVNYLISTWNKTETTHISEHLLSKSQSVSRNHLVISICA